MKRQWIGFGKDVESFEEAYKEKFGLQSFAMVDSGSNALYLAIKLLDIQPYSQIILPSFTWVSCAHAVILAGHEPVFCDVDLDTMNVTHWDIKKKITRYTGAIMVVHYAGLSCDMDPILELGYPVIEDAAHAINSTYKGKLCGTIGDVGIYSFDAVKNLTTGEGGGVTARNPDLITKAKQLRYCGIGKSGFDTAMSDGNGRWWEHEIYEPFIKMLPTNIAACIGLAQLKRFDALQKRRKQIWDMYQKNLMIPEITLPVGAKDDRHSYFTFCIRANKRDDLAKFLLKKGIYTTLRYKPLHYYPIFKQTDVSLPFSERLEREALNIPLHPRMTDEEVNRVISGILEFYGRG